MTKKRKVKIKIKKPVRVKIPVPSGTGFFHVTAGIQGVWDPTPEEMGEIVDLFVNAINEEGVVVTRNGITCDFHQVP